MDVALILVSIFVVCLIFREIGWRKFLITAVIITSVSFGYQKFSPAGLGNMEGYINENPSGSIKLQAYVDNASPAVGSVINLIVYGPPGGKVTAICHFKEHDEPYIFDIGASGMVVKPVKISTAVRKYTVMVDIIVNYNGKTYRTNTVFTPN